MMRIRLEGQLPGGFTMIEMLAVLVILGALSVVTVSSLSSADAQEQLERLAARMQQLDRLGRVHCGAIGALELIAEPDTGHVILRERTSRQAISREQRPDGATVTIRNVDDDEHIHCVVISRDGRSADYSVLIELDDMQRSWSVAGLTGFITREHRSHD